MNRAARVLATSRYSAERAMEFYGLREMPAIVPELIDLAEWRRILAGHPRRRSLRRPGFTVLFVGRFYHRKRVPVLLRAAAMLRPRLPESARSHRRQWPVQCGLARAGAGITDRWGGDLAGRCFARATCRRIQPRRCILPSQRPGRFRHRIVGSDGGGKADCGIARGGHSRSSAARRAGGAGQRGSVRRRNRAGLRIAATAPDRVEQFDAPLVARRFLEAVAGLDRP